jgi:hypothetical protein
MRCLAATEKQKKPRRSKDFNRHSRNSPKSKEKPLHKDGWYEAASVGGFFHFARSSVQGISYSLRP